ncbi:HK97 gp10 family phage protein [Crossiella sp. CA198]|uniref:HK97 gp10 family phage protein n=1 Tax=Crossiella sp. CA198 TaxID=3455607 RepID=UPI003F8D72E0
MHTRIHVEGMKELRRELGALDRNAMRRTLRGAHVEVADLVAAEAKSTAPRRTGRLAASVRGTASESKAYVMAGTSARVPYAGPIHFGVPASRIRPPRNITADRFIWRAMGRRYDAAAEKFRDAIARALQRINTT